MGRSVAICPQTLRLLHDNPRITERFGSIHLTSLVDGCPRRSDLAGGLLVGRVRPTHKWHHHLKNGLCGADGRSVGQRLARRDAGRDVRRVRPHAEDQREPGPRSLGACQSAVLAGGGIQGGQVYGTSDRDSAYPTSKPVSPEDMLATIYHAMGIAPNLEMYDQLGRPHRVVEGKPLTALF
jgi:hypothetical protein